MKRTITLALTLAAFITTTPAAFATIPGSVEEARRNAQAQGLVVAVGEARLARATPSRNAARLASRGELVTVLGTMVGTAQTLHMEYFEVNYCYITKTFFEDITTLVSESRLLGSTIIHEYRERDGRHWAVMVLPRDNVIAEIAVAAAAATVAPDPAGTATAPDAPLSPFELGRLSAMDAIRRMDEALDLHFRNIE